MHFFLKIENRICYLYYNKPTAIANVEQIIYLDGDIIVEGDIEELWNIPIGEHALMAVSEMFHEAHYVSSPLALHTFKKLNIPEKSKYFNAGVLKINIKKWLWTMRVYYQSRYWRCRFMKNWNWSS